MQADGPSPGPIDNLPGTMTMRVFTFLLCLFLPLATPAGEAPPFTAATAKGETVELPRDHDGVDIYLFWATWCPYCERLMPHLQSVEDEYGDRVKIFAINFRDDGDARGYVEERGFEFALIPDGGGAAEAYDMHGTPGLVLVDGEGNIRFNLYDLHEPASKALEDLEHGQRAERLAPWWAARIRQKIDGILGTD